jgi:hypothetical protein
MRENNCLYKYVAMNTAHIWQASEQVLEIVQV